MVADTSHRLALLGLSPLKGEEPKLEERGAAAAFPLPSGERCRAQRGGEGMKTRKREKGINERARSLRQGDNMAEAILWNELKAKRLGGYKFVRQMPIGPYFADFVCRSRKLVVELDGSQHADSAYDRRRDEIMRAQGYSVIRFWSADLSKDIAGVCETILAALDGELREDTLALDLRFVFAKAHEKSEGSPE